MALWRENKEVESKMTAQFQSSMTEWIGLPFSKLDNLKMGNKLVRYLEFHLWCVVFQMVMGHPGENVLGKWKYGPGIQERFSARDTDYRGHESGGEIEDLGVDGITEGENLE